MPAGQRNGSPADRVDPTLNALRQNWAIILVIVLGIISAVRTEMTVQQLERQMVEIEKLLNREAFTKFAVWQTNTDRDIKELREKIAAK
jgi:hypothetical protein